MEFAPKYRDILFGPVSVLPSNKSENNDFLLGCSLDPSRSALKGACLEKFLLNWGPPKHQETTC